jgi:hypothetical protein
MSGSRGHPLWPSRRRPVNARLWRRRENLSSVMFLRQQNSYDAGVSSGRGIVTGGLASMHRCIRPTGLNGWGGKGRVLVC